MFSCEFCKISENTFFSRTPTVAACQKTFPNNILTNLCIKYFCLIIRIILNQRISRFFSFYKSICNINFKYLFFSMFSDFTQNFVFSCSQYYVQIYLQTDRSSQHRCYGLFGKIHMETPVLSLFFHKA